jgi:hypothetical protein
MKNGIFQLCDGQLISQGLMDLFRKLGDETGASLFHPPVYGNLFKN